MFTYIRMKNFKSFKDVTLDLSLKRNVAKKIALIYGGNGSGKTTIAQAFILLERTVETMEIRGMLNDLLDEKLSPPDDFPLKQDVMYKMLKTRLSMNGIESIIKSYKMIGSSENLSVEYQFVIDGNTGSYYIEMDDNEIVNERLEYKLSKRRGCYFNLQDEEIKINDRIFETREFYELIYKQAKMYWGKHSLLSILMYEMTDKSDTFINSNISQNLMDVILLLTGIQYKIFGNQGALPSDKLLENLQIGTIEKSDQGKLLHVERILDGIFKSIFKNVVKVFYQKSIEGDKIGYRLYLRKQIDGKTFDIDFALESSGTREILKLLPFFVTGASGGCVVIDEYGTSIHDVLSAKILESVAKQITGQMIITTHNTMIMECSTLNPESLYFIMDDKSYQKSVRCVTEIEERLHPKYNYRTRYLYNELYQDAKPDISGEFDLSGLVEMLN